MSKLVVVISGRKGSGKDTFAHMLAANMYGILHPDSKTHMLVNDNGELMAYHSADPTDGELVRLRGPGSDKDVERYGVKILAFADYLKQMCMDLFGLSYEQCYGTNAQKDTPTQIMWENFPLWVRLKYSGAKWWNPLSWSPRFGPMTGREVLQVVGTEVVRTIHWHAWADALYRMAGRAKEWVVIVPDARFPNELDRARHVLPPDTEVRMCRLLRHPHPGDTHPSETSLNDYPLDNYDEVFHKDITLSNMKLAAEELAEKWLEETGIGL